MPKKSLNPIGPSSDDYQAFLAKRPDLAVRMKARGPRLTAGGGYEIWRNAWLACEIEHGIRSPDWNK